MKSETVPKEIPVNVISDDSDPGVAEVAVTLISP